MTHPRVLVEDLGQLIERHFRRRPVVRAKLLVLEGDLMLAAG